MCKTYSRCGKTCDERFNTAKDDRAMMLLGEKVTFRRSDPLLTERKNAEELDDVIRNIKTHRERISTAHSKHNSPIFLAQGRDEYYNSVRNNDKVPPCGYYNLENQQLQKCKSIPNFSKKPKHKSRVPKAKIDVPLRIVDKPMRKTLSSNLFKFQLDRPGLEKMCLDVNEKRFESTIPTPPIFSKSKKIVSPDFSLGKGHELDLPVTMNSRIYNPNYVAIWKNTSRPLLEFEKYPARKPILFHVTDLDYQKKSYKQTDKAVPSVYFDRSGSRPSSTCLPVFMVVSDI